MNLNFYNKPFHQDEYGTWVWDARNNFVFQFAKSVSREERDLIIFRLNALNKTTEKVPDYELTYSNTMIQNNEEDFIEIRGWGNLTGIGGHKFEAEKAAKIQDDFANWIMDTLK
jgi:hypothetical protein